MPVKEKPKETLICLITGEEFELIRVYPSGWGFGKKGQDAYAHLPGTFKIFGNKPKPPPAPPRKFRGGDTLYGLDEQVQRRLNKYSQESILDPNHQLKLIGEHIGIQPSSEIEQLKKAVAEYYSTKSTGPK